jgi:hypothetical protein
MKITDVIELVEAEQAFGTPGSKAMGSANFALLSRFYTRPKNRTSANLTLNFGAGKLAELTTDDVEAIAKYYDTLPADADRYDFVYDTMSRADKFNALLYRLGLRQPPKPPIPTTSQTAMDLSEREVKKNSSTDLDRSSVRSAGLSTALRQAYAKYPQAQSDIEALVMHDLDVQKNTGQELQAQNKINRRQDDIDIQLRDVNRQQSKKISSLDDENDALSAELDKLSRELDAMHRQTGAEPERKKDSDNSEKPASDSDSSRNYGVNVRSSDRAEKKQQRAADAEKRKPEPEAAKLRPGSATFKPLGSTIPMVKPTPAPMPTIDVIDKPSASLATTPEPVEEPYQDPAEFTPPPSLGKPETDSEVAPDAKEPNNVFQFPNRLSKPNNEPAAMDQPDLFDNPPRTGTYNENRELRRMRELAGLPQ